MPEWSKLLLGKQAKELGFVRDTYEKVCRLTEILKFFENDAKRVFLEPPDRSTESHWRAEIRAGGAGPRAIEANTNIKSHLS